MTKGQDGFGFWPKLHVARRSCWGRLVLGASTGQAECVLLSPQRCRVMSASRHSHRTELLLNFVLVQRVLLFPRLALLAQKRCALCRRCGSRLYGDRSSVLRMFRGGYVFLEKPKLGACFISALTRAQELGTPSSRAPSLAWPLRRGQQQRRPRVSVEPGLPPAGLSRRR